MKAPAILFAILALAAAPRLSAGESALTVTHQPLDGLGAERIVISQVTCHDWFGHGGGSSVELISAPNVPPTNNPKEASQNLNLASLCGLSFAASDLGDPDAPLKLTLNATKLAFPKNFGYAKEDFIRASLECLRLSLPAKLRKTPLTLEASASNKAWLEPLVREFNAHNRGKVFYKPAE